MSDGINQNYPNVRAIPRPQTEEQRRWWNHAIEAAERVARNVAEAGEVCESKACERVGREIERRVRGLRDVPMPTEEEKSQALKAKKKGSSK